MGTVTLIGAILGIITGIIAVFKVFAQNKILTAITGNDLKHLLSDINEVKNDQKGMWKEINKIKDDVKNNFGDIRALKGKLNNKE